MMVICELQGEKKSSFPVLLRAECSQSYLALGFRIQLFDAIFRKLKWRRRAGDLNKKWERFGHTGSLCLIVLFKYVLGEELAENFF